MDTLLLERATGRISARACAATVTESLYGSLSPSTFRAHSAAVNSLALEKAEYRYLLSGSGDSSLRLWDLSEDEIGPIRPPRAIATVSRRTAHRFGVSALRWWPEDTGMFISASFDHTVQAWDTNRMAPAHVFEAGARVYAVDVCAARANRFSSQALVAVASDQPQVRLLDLRAGAAAHTLQGHKGKTLAVTWHPQQPSILATGGFDGEVKVWDVRRAQSCLCRMDMARTNASRARTDISSGGYSALPASSSESSDDESTINNASMYGSHLKHSPFRPRQTNVDRLEYLSSTRAHLGPVNGLLWDEAGHMLYSAGNDDKIRVWDMEHSPPVNRLVNFGPLTRNKYLQTAPVALSARSEGETQHLVFGADTGDVLVLRALDGKLMARLPGRVRTSAMVAGAPYSATYFGGTMSGDIVTWRGMTRPPAIEGEYKDEEVDDVVPLDEIMCGSGEKEIAALYDDPYFRRESS